MAMTAWSAKVFSSSTCAVENGPGSGRRALMAPIGCAVPQHRDADRMLRIAHVRASLLSPYSGSSSTSGICTTARVQDRPARGAVLAQPRIG